MYILEICTCVEIRRMFIFLKCSCSKRLWKCTLNKRKQTWQVMRKVLQMEFSPGGLEKSLPSGAWLPTWADFRGERNMSQIAPCSCVAFAAQGSSKVHGTPLRGAGRMTEGQMAFPVQSGYNEALRHQQVPSGRECSHTFFGLKKQCLTALNVSS